MNSVRNLSRLGSDMIHTLFRGSMTERLVLGSLFAITGIVITEKIYKWATRFFAKPQHGAPLTHMTPLLDEEFMKEYEQRLRGMIGHPVVAPHQQNPPLPSPEPQRYSLLSSLSIRNQPLLPDQEPRLAQALHSYQELKTAIDGDEERFIFMIESYRPNNLLPATLIWEAKHIEIEIPSHFNKAFKGLDENLKTVGLKWEDIKGSDQPLGKASFKDQSTKELFNLGDLYQIVKLQGPHILSPLEIHLKKEKITGAKAALHQSRLEIISKTLSTLRAVLIDEMLNSFPIKHSDLYSLFGNKPENLRFVVENICWHALDLALESIETTFVPTEKKQQEHQQSELKNLLTKGLPDETKRKQAESFLTMILEEPNNTQAIDSLVHLLISEKEANPDRESLIKRVQDPKLQLEEERIQQELGGLEAIQKFFTTVLFAVGVVDQGKTALQIKKEGEEKKNMIVIRPLLQPQAPHSPLPTDQKTYAQQIEKASTAVTKAGERAIENIASQQWQSTLDSVNRQLQLLPSVSQEKLQQIIDNGWTHSSHEQIALGKTTKQQRWLMTQAMICQKLALASLETKGRTLVEEVGKWVSSFVKTLYGRLITVLLAFEQRTRETASGDAKPADRIAEAFIDPLVKSLQALQKVKKTDPQAGKTEDEIVKELGKNKEMHPSASNKRSADAVFLGKLILEVLSILQPEGLSGDIREVLAKNSHQSGELDPTFLQKIIEKYKTSILPTAKPWIQPVWTFLIQALQNIIERQSAHNMADQMSDWFNPVNINDYLVDFLMQDTSQLNIEPDSKDKKDPLKWYGADEQNLKERLTERKQLKQKITACEKELLKLKKEQKSNEEINKEFIENKKRAFVLDTRIAPELLRRIVIANASPSLVGYAVQIADNLFELIQYPRIVRNVAFHVLEKTVQSLAQPLDEGKAPVSLDLSMNQPQNQPFFDFLFSDTLKNGFGNKLLDLLWSMPTEKWTAMGLLTQTATRILPGHVVFSRLQTKIEELIKKKFENPEAINWSVAKLVSAIDAKIIQFADDRTDQGMTAIITSQLNKALGSKRL